MQDVYTEVFSLEAEESQKLLKDLGKKYKIAGETFEDFPDEEYPELKMLTDAVASSKIISAKKSEELVQKLCRLTSTTSGRAASKICCFIQPCQTA